MGSLGQVTQTACKDREFNVEQIKEDFFVKRMWRAASAMQQSFGHAQTIPCLKMGTN
jgi:hypothetical protein